MIHLNKLVSNVSNEFKQARSYHLSLYTNIEVVCFGVIDFVENWNYCFRQLINLHVPHF